MNLAPDRQPEVVAATPPPGVLREIQTSHTPLTMASRLAHLPGTVLLHSAASADPLASHSILACQPESTLQAWGNDWILHSQDRLGDHGTGLWAEVETLARTHAPLTHSNPPFPAGGLFGFWSYESGMLLEPRLCQLRPSPPHPTPDCWLGLYASNVVWDHQSRRVWVACRPGLPPQDVEKVIGEWETRLRSHPARPQPPQVGPIAPSAPRIPITKAEFASAVRRAQLLIRQGDIYQVNLSHPLQAATSLSGWQLYERLISLSPSPFSAYLNCGDTTLASVSPELFLRMNGRRILTRPIKGTRPRGKTPDEDARLTRELVSSPKERAELVMITDLLRNDLGRVCRYGSVHVPEIAALELHPYVQHLVSTVAGELDIGLSHLDALKACFPGGSITGAPKTRAMEIIRDLERFPRGPYTGALGYLGANGASQFNILIRTAVLCRGLLTYGAGAGIVADSDPESEYEETLHKSAAFLAALGANRETLALHP